MTALKSAMAMKLAEGLTPAEQPHPVRGTGGGMADAIPAMIDGDQPAAIAEGEFVIPADVVSFLGDGSSEAGARSFQDIIDQVREQNGFQPEAQGEVE